MSLLPFDQRDGWIWMDGELTPWREARVHYLTHAFHYGSAVFEGLRAYNGKIFKLTEHSARLLESARLMDMACPYALDQINAACDAAVAANRLQEAYVRPLLWRGTEQMSVGAAQTKCRLAVAAWEWPSFFPPAVREEGITVMTSPWRRPSPDSAPVHAKASGLYVICTLSKHIAERDGYTDALMLDYRGQVAELTGANFFMVKDGVLHTPTPDCFLNGITRQTVMALARDAGLKVVERAIMPEELAGADECFATGTAAEVVAIGRIDGKTYKVGPVTRLLREKYEALVRS